MNTYLKKFNTISVRLFVTYSLVFILLLGTSLIVIMAVFKQLMVQQFGEERIEVLKQIGERSNSINNVSRAVSNLFAYDTYLLKSLEAEFMSDSEREELGAYLDNVKAGYDQVFGDISLQFEVVVIGENGFSYSSRAGSNYAFAELKKQLWYVTVLERSENIVYITSFNDDFAHNDDPGVKHYVFSVARNVYDKSKKKIGSLLINVDEELLFSLSGLSAEDENNIYIVDSGGNVVSHREKSSLGMNFINMDRFEEMYGFNTSKVLEKLGEEYILCSYRDEQTGWLLISEVPVRVIIQPLKSAYFIVTAVLLCGIAISLLLSALISHSISNPLRQLCRNMEQMLDESFEVMVSLQGYREINQLQTSFNKMAADIMHLMEEVRIRENNRRRAELDCLRAQINPHFLYNTLFSIRCLIETDQNEKAVVMMSSFITLLKKTLSTNAALVTLAGELATCRTYMQLQSFRYGNKVLMEADIDEEVSECMVPQLILQPIIENALFHGLEPKPEGGTIVVDGYAGDGFLFVAVSDDGVGMDPETVKRLQTQKYKPLKNGDNIGVANVNNRIKINFGKRYGIDIYSKTGQGTTITLRLPLLYQHQYEEGDENEYSDCR